MATSLRTSHQAQRYCHSVVPLPSISLRNFTGFSPHEAHAHLAFFGWILPTIRTSEFTVLQIVGLDAAVVRGEHPFLAPLSVMTGKFQLLSFLKMSFWLFSTCSVFAAAILMPINLKVGAVTTNSCVTFLTVTQNNIDIGDGREDGTNSFEPPTSSDPQIPRSSWDNWFDLISDASSYLSVHLMFTYIFTILALRAIYKNFKRFIRSRQLFSLELVHSVPARTVMVSHLPPHLRTEPALAEYFEQMDLSVESVNICREVGSLRRLLDVRTKALVKLESAWVDYLGNPSVVAPDTSIRYPLVDVDDSASIESQPEQLVLPNRKRPTIRPGWFSRKVDAIEYYEDKFREADELVKKRRRSGRFKPTHAAFVTFEKMSSAVRQLVVWCEGSELTLLPLANRRAGRACPTTHAVPDTSRARTKRHRVAQHLTFSCQCPCARMDCHGSNGRASILLVHSDHRIG